MQYDEDYPVGEPCLKCGSANTIRSDFAWECKDCLDFWIDEENYELVTNLTAEDALEEVKAAVINVSGLDFKV